MVNAQNAILKKCDFTKCSRLALWSNKGFGELIYACDEHHVAVESVWIQVKKAQERIKLEKKRKKQELNRLLRGTS
jgi:hypothetical protein